ncbi:MAG: type II toxin-antitoxin system Phd/YefM family antitoxin, partial [Steroidobacteraceae bacterium]
MSGAIGNPLGIARRLTAGAAEEEARRSRLHMWLQVAIFTFMTSTGIRELKDRLSHFIRQVEAGGRVAVTAHGR